MGDMEIREIPLTQGKTATVNAADYDWLMQWKWYACRNRKSWYALRSVLNSAGNWTSISMHRTIIPMAETPGFPQLDHRDGNGLNNTRGNLRPATRSGNQANRTAQANCKSGIRGVYWNKKLQKYQAQIIWEGRTIHLGYFAAIEQAADTRDAAMKKYHGEYARTSAA